MKRQKNNADYYRARLMVSAHFARGHRQSGPKRPGELRRAQRRLVLASSGPPMKYSNWAACGAHLGAAPIAQSAPNGSPRLAGLEFFGAAPFN